MIPTPGTSSKQPRADTPLKSILRSSPESSSSDAKTVSNASLSVKAVRTVDATTLSKIRSKSARSAQGVLLKHRKAGAASSSTKTDGQHDAKSRSQEEASARQEAMMRDMKPAFDIMLLNGSDVRLIQESFENIDVSQSGTIDIRELETFLKIDRSPFNGRVLAMFDADESGELDFFEYLVMVWNYCSMDNYNLVKFAFQLYNHDEHKKRRKNEKVVLPPTADKRALTTTNADLLGIEDMYDVYVSRDGGSVISREQIRCMMQEVYGSGLEKNPQVLNIVNNMPKGVYDMQEFTDFMKSHQSLLYPTFLIQQKLRHFVGGHWFWSRHTDVRNKLKEEDFVSIISLMREAQVRSAGEVVAEEIAVRNVTTKALVRIDKIRSVSVKNNRKVKRLYLKSYFPRTFVALARAASLSRRAASYTGRALSAGHRVARTVVSKMPSSGRVNALGSKAVGYLSMTARRSVIWISKEFARFAKSPYFSNKFAMGVRAVSVAPHSDVPVGASPRPLSESVSVKSSKLRSRVSSQDLRGMSAKRSPKRDLKVTKITSVTGSFLTTDTSSKDLLYSGMANTSAKSSRSIKGGMSARLTLDENAFGTLSPADKMRSPNVSKMQLEIGGLSPADKTKSPNVSKLKLDSGALSPSEKIKSLIVPQKKLDIATFSPADKSKSPNISKAKLDIGALSPADKIKSPNLSRMKLDISGLSPKSPSSNVSFKLKPYSNSKSSTLFSLPENGDL